METIQDSRNWLRGSTLPQKKSTSTSNIISRSSRNSHQQKWNTCQGFVSLLILASQPILIASACGLLINPHETYKQSGTVCVEGSVKSMFESVVRRCTKYLKAMTSRQAPAKMFMYAAITHCQGKITQRALALWHLQSWHLDVPPKAYNSRREIQEPKGPVLSCKSTCQSTRETIGNNSALKKLAERIYTATKKEY